MYKYFMYIVVVAATNNFICHFDLDKHPTNGILCFQSFQNKKEMLKGTPFSQIFNISSRGSIFCLITSLTLPTENLHVLLSIYQGLSNYLCHEFPQSPAEYDYKYPHNNSIIKLGFYPSLAISWLTSSKFLSQL